jgi:hypothetical protein
MLLQLFIVDLLYLFIMAGDGPLLPFRIHADGVLHFVLPFNIRHLFIVRLVHPDGWDVDVAVWLDHLHSPVALAYEVGPLPYVGTS